MRCLVVDDHPFMSAGVSALLSSEFPDAVLTAVSTVREAIDIIDTHSDESITLILLDILLPDENGIGVLKHLQKTGQSTAFLSIVISGVNDQETIALCKRLGARGYVCKTEDLGRFADAMRIVLNGGEYFHAGESHTRPGNFLDKADRLTSRQRDVLDLVLAGYSNKKIADVLGLSYGTIKNYIHALLTEFAVNTRLEIATCARNSGYVSKYTNTTQASDGDKTLKT